MDIDATPTDNVYAAGAGVVDSWGSYWVIIWHEAVSRYSKYEHLSQVDPAIKSKGKQVNENTVLGKAGDAGNSTPGYVHLHFEVAPGTHFSSQTSGSVFVDFNACDGWTQRQYPRDIIRGASSWIQVPRNTRITSTGTYCAAPLERTILNAPSDQDPNAGVSYAFHDGEAHWIPDRYTYWYLARRDWPVREVPTEALIKQLRVGAPESHKVDAVDLPYNTIVTDGRRVFAVDNGSAPCSGCGSTSGTEADGAASADSEASASAERMRHGLTPDSRLCFERKNGWKLIDLAPEQIDMIKHAGDVWGCSFNTVVRVDDGASYFVDNTNTKYWIPDADTYRWYVRRHGVLGPLPSAQVYGVLQGDGRTPYRIDGSDVPNSIVRYASATPTMPQGVYVDYTGIAHPIPSYGDNMCWQYLQQKQVTRNIANRTVFDEVSAGFSVGGQIGSPVPCPTKWIAAANEGASYLVSGNLRGWIQDPESFYCYQDRGFPTLRGHSQREIKPIPEGPWMPRCLSPYRVNNKIVRHRGGTAYYVDGAGSWHWIPTGAVWDCLRARGVQVLISDATWEQINSLRIDQQHEGPHATCGGGQTAGEPDAQPAVASDAGNQPGPESSPAVVGGGMQAG